MSCCRAESTWWCTNYSEIPGLVRFEEIVPFLTKSLLGVVCPDAAASRRRVRDGMGVGGGKVSARTTEESYSEIGKTGSHKRAKDASADPAKRR